MTISTIEESELPELMPFTLFYGQIAATATGQVSVYGGAAGHHPKCRLVGAQYFSLANG